MPQQLKTCRRKTIDDEFFTMYKDGTIKPVHCGWIANFPDTWGENKLLKGE